MHPSSSSWRAGLVAVLSVGVSIIHAADQHSPASRWGTSSIESMLQARTELADALIAGTLTPDAALRQLGRLTFNPGAERVGDESIAEVAMDIGQRLWAADRSAAAQVFFDAADAILTGLIERTPDKDSAPKSQLLNSRAFVRGQFLRRMAEAKADLDKADQLEPGNTRSRDVRERFAREHAAVLGSCDHE